MIGEMFANNPWLSQNATQVGVVGLTDSDQSADRNVDLFLVYISTKTLKVDKLCIFWNIEIRIGVVLFKCLRFTTGLEV